MPRSSAPPSTPRPRQWLRPPVDGFPPELRAYTLRLHGFLVATGVAWLGLGVWGLAGGHALTATLSALMTASVAAMLWWVRRQYRADQLRLASQLSVALATVGLVVLAMLTGQGHSLALWGLVLVPLHVAYQEGQRTALAWLLIVVGLTVVVHASELAVPVPAEVSTSAAEGLLGHLALVALVAGVGWQARQTHEELVRLLREQDRASRARSQTLTQSLGQAHEATRAQGRFLASMSHEIRTPLNGIVGLTDVLRSSPLPADERELVRTIHKSSRHLLDVLNNILDYTKLESSHTQLTLEAYSIEENIEDVLGLLAEMASEQGLDLASDLDDDLPRRAIGDATRVRQILLNLATNALKFTRQGSVVIGARVDGESLVYEVRDTGPGLTQSEQEQLFQPFRQTVTSQRSRFDLGSGLGLVISRRLAELMKGKLTLRSQVGQGTTFTLTLPLREPDGPSSEPESLLPAVRRLVILEPREATAASLAASARHCVFEPVRVTEAELGRELARADVLVASELPDTALAVVRAAASQRPLRILLCVPPSSPALPEALVALGAERLSWPASRRQLREALLGRDLHGRPESTSRLAVAAERRPLAILVAEDNPINRTVMERTLRRLGYEPDFANDGLSAIEAAARRPYDLILMDVQMPVLDGLGATRRIRHELPHQPRIIAVSAGVLPEQQAACKLAGMDGFLRKPFEVAELTAVLQDSPVLLPPVRTATMFDPTRFEQLRELVDNDRSELASLVEEYESNTRLLQQQMRESVPASRVEELCRAAHTLKSSSALMGASGLASLCASLEEVTREGKLPADVTTRIEAIERAGAESFRWLHEQIGA